MLDARPIIKIKDHEAFILKTESLKIRAWAEYSDWPEYKEKPYKKINSARVDGEIINITHINHSTLLIQTQGINIITDPIYSYRCSPVQWAGPSRVVNPGVRFEDLPKIDVVIISHDHYDHLDLDTIERLVERDNPKIYLGLGAGRHLSSMNNVTELDWWEFSQVNEKLKVNFVPVQHFSGRGLFDRNSTLWGGYVLEFPAKKIYFGGDSGYASHYQDTYQKFGSIDVALIPIGGYDPRTFMKYAHVNPEEAVKAHLDLKSKKSIGMHYGTFQLTAEKINDPVDELNIAKEKYNILPADFIAAEFGQTVVIGEGL